MTFEIPHIRVKAKYESSGVLILVRASGAGDYWGEYGKLLILRAYTIPIQKKYSLNSTNCKTIIFFFSHFAFVDI